MAKAILTTKVDPTYDDLPEQRYHFPRTYLRAVEAAKRDWIIYYEPRRSSGDLSSRGGRQSYFATARIVEIVDDGTRPGHFYALIDSYLDLRGPCRSRKAAIITSPLFDETTAIRTRGLSAGRFGSCPTSNMTRFCARVSRQSFPSTRRLKTASK